ncbi:MAG: energy transducer TonB [Gammaproteobacteria bacterium]|nr:energy transducer TonB [Gammaproteobacteria bacterium]MYF62337.1 energy transducer TonB [Gammaproteobacteria bacterium]MYI22096.1 energy transducer TonB [Gammaproteobacteria bacterium]
MFAPTANDRFKAQWGDRLAWSIVVAVSVHVAGFAFFPGWRLRDLSPEPIFGARGTEWILLQPPGPNSGLEAIAFAAVSGAGEDSAAAAEVEEGEQDDVDPAAFADAAAGGGGGSFLDRLRGRAAPRPVVVEPELAVAEAEAPADAQSEGTSGDDALSIGGSASTASLESLPDPEELDLDRLSVLEPELSLTSLSAWVLVRNPDEVMDFMRRSAAQEGLAEEDFMTVRVTLWIDRRGSVEWSEIMESSGDRRVDEIALELVNEVISFRPAREQGVAVARSAVFSIPFPWT